MLDGMGRRQRGGMHRTQPRVRGPRRQPPSPPRTPASADAGASLMPPDEVAAHLRRLAAHICGWCGDPIAVKATGRLPKWCSQSCRQRAWEQARAAASGLSAIRVIERRVEVPFPAAPARGGWPVLLQELGRQLDDGRVYDRHLPELATALNAVLEAYSRRPHVRNRGVGRRLTGGDIASAWRPRGDVLGEEDSDAHRSGVTSGTTRLRTPREG